MTGEKIVISNILFASFLLEGELPIFFSFPPNFTCFSQGKIGVDSFDQLVEEAGFLPRRSGFAPPTNVRYPTVEARKAARAEMFRKMYTDNNGYITLEEWIKFSIDNIKLKTKTLPKASSQTNKINEVQINPKHREGILFAKTAHS